MVTSTSMRVSLFLSSFLLSFSISDIAKSLDLDADVGDAAVPVMEPISEVKGWYLRADIGTDADFDASSSSFSTFSVANGVRNGSVLSRSYKNQPLSIGGGAGYKFNDVFRADATIDLLRGEFSQSGSGLDTCSGAPSGTSCALSTTASFSNIMFMANAYVDLATISGFTPYLGAGLGATQVNWSDASLTGTCVNGTGSCGTTADVTSSQSGQTNWRTTWSLMAGVSYELNERVNFDLGYRYSRTPSGTISIDSNGASTRDGGFDHHQIRAGLRISGW